MCGDIINDIRKVGCDMGKKFEVIGEYQKDISLEKLLDNVKPTRHMEEERCDRYDDDLSCLDKNDKIEKVFIVDTGHH